MTSDLSRSERKRMRRKRKLELFVAIENSCVQLPGDFTGGRIKIFCNAFVIVPNSTHIALSEGWPTYRNGVPKFSKIDRMPKFDTFITIRIYLRLLTCFSIGILGRIRRCEVHKAK